MEEIDDTLSNLFGVSENPTLDSILESSVLDESILDNPNIQPVTTPPKKTAAKKRSVQALQEPIVEDNPFIIQDEKPARKKLIIRRVVVDKFNTACKRVELTPSVCDECGFDVAEKIGGWYNVGNDSRPQCLAAVKKHKEVVHSKAAQLIIYEDEMPTSWLGGGRRL